LGTLGKKGEKGYEGKRFLGAVRADKEWTFVEG